MVTVQNDNELQLRCDKCNWVLIEVDMDDVTLAKIDVDLKIYCGLCDRVRPIP